MKPETYELISIELLMVILFEIGILLQWYGYKILISGADSWGDSPSAPLSVSGIIYVIGSFMMILSVLIGAFFILPDKSEQKSQNN